uniref:BAR domain-containing protein n=1 Tax=Acrobeloides nanus TaxID=290746 RepID=A0A914E5B0_9BILA
MAWSVFKQKLRELMRKEQVTSIPAEIECQMKYIESSKEHITAIDISVEKMIYPWNKSGSNNSEGIADTTGTMGRKIEKFKAGRTLVACSESHKYIGKLERKAHEDIRKFVHKEFCQAWINGDYSRLSKISKNVKDSRVNYDARKADYNKKQTEENELRKKRAEDTFIKYAEEAATAFAHLPALQKRQVEMMKQFLKRMKDHYDQCYAALKTTIQKM